MKTKVELLDEIVKKQEKQIRLLTDFIHGIKWLKSRLTDK